MTITIDLSEDLQARAEALAAARGEPLETVLQEAIELYLLAPPPETGPLKTRMAQNEVRLRAYCAERGLDWDAMSDDEREELISQLVHEARHAAPGGL